LVLVICTPCSYPTHTFTDLPVYCCIGSYTLNLVTFSHTHLNFGYILDTHVPHTFYVPLVVVVFTFVVDILRYGYSVTVVVLPTR